MRPRADVPERHEIALGHDVREGEGPVRESRAEGRAEAEEALQVLVRLARREVRHEVLGQDPFGRSVLQEDLQ